MRCTKVWCCVCLIGNGNGWNRDGRDGKDGLYIPFDEVDMSLMEEERNPSVSCRARHFQFFQIGHDQEGNIWAFLLYYWLFSVSFFLPPKGHCMVPSLSILSNNDHRETNHLLLDFVFMLTKLERLMVYVLFHDFYNAMCLLVINVLS